MTVFKPDEKVVRKIVRVIKDVLQHGTDPTEFVEQSDSVEPVTAMLSTMDIKSTEAGNEKVAEDATINMKPTVAANETMAVNSTTDMECTVTVNKTAAVDPTIFRDQKADVEMTVAVNQTVDTKSVVIVDKMVAVDPVVDVDPAMDVASQFSSDPSMPKDFSASVKPTTILNPEKPLLTLNQKYKFIVSCLNGIEYNPLESYLMVIMKRSSIDQSTRLMSGSVLNYQLSNYYEGIPSAVIEFLSAECLTSIGDISPSIRDCNCSLIKQLAIKGLRYWPEIWLAIAALLNSRSPSVCEGALDILQMMINKFDLEELPNNPIDILVPKLITLIGTTSLTKRTKSVSIVKELISRKSPGLRKQTIVLVEKLLLSDYEYIMDENEVNKKTLLSIDVCISITTLVQNRRLPKDNMQKIIRYMIDKSKAKDDKIVYEACKFWITIFKEQLFKHRNIVFPYLNDIISALIDKLMFTQKDLISIQNGHVSIDYPFFTDSDSIKKHCVNVIVSMISAFKENILPGIVQIINKKVKDKDTNIKEISIVLLGCIAENRELRKSVEPYLEKTFHKLILLDNYLFPGESLFRDKLLWTLVAYRDFIVDQPHYMVPLMSYMLRSEIKCPQDYQFIEGEAFWNLVTDECLSKDAFRPYLTDTLSIIFKGLNNNKILSDEVVKHDQSADRNTRNNSTDAFNNLIGIYKVDTLPIIMPMINESIDSDDPKTKESGIVALGLLAKGGISDMIIDVPLYLAYMVDTLSGDNPNLSAAACLSLGRYHDWIVNRSSHYKYFVPLMEYLLTNEDEGKPTDPYTLACVLSTLEFLLLDKPNSEEIFAPYLKRIVVNMCNAIIYSDSDIISLQGDDEIDKDHPDGSTIICKEFELYLQDKNDDKIPQYKCSSESYNRGRASYILYNITKIYKRKILPIIVPIIQKALKSDNWKVMESGIFALGAINYDKHFGNPFTDVEWFLYFKGFLRCMMGNLTNSRPIVRANTMVTLSRYSTYIIKKSKKQYLLPLVRMISERALDSNRNVQTTALQVWYIFRHQVTDDEVVLKWCMGHNWNELMNMVEYHRNRQCGQDNVQPVDYPSFTQG